MKNSFLLFGLFLMLCGCRTTTAVNSRMMPEENSAQPRIIFASDISYDAEKGIVKYTLPEDALVRIRIGIKDGGPLLRTLLDWVPRKTGTHQELWDFKDQSGLVDYAHRRDIVIVLNAVDAQAGADEDLFRSAKGYKKQPTFLVEFPNAEIKDDSSFLTGKTPVRISLSKEDQRWLTETKYELAFYVDGTFLMEDEEGTNPFTIYLDTNFMNDGLHHLIVNLVTYDGDMGTTTVPFNVKNR